MWVRNSWLHCPDDCCWTTPRIRQSEFCFPYYWCFEQKRAGTPESGDSGPLTFHRGGNGGGGAFHRSIICNFMAYQDRLETYLLQLFAHPETSDRAIFYNLSVIIFEVNIVAKQKPALLVKIFLSFHCSHLFYCPPALPLARRPWKRGQNC